MLPTKFHIVKKFQVHICMIHAQYPTCDLDYFVRVKTCPRRTSVFSSSCQRQCELLPYNYLMYPFSIPETTVIIYGISIERCVLYKCNADRWSCTCFRNGVWGGEFVVKVWFFFLFCLNKHTIRISF
jgi:hypothetical protein